MSEDKHTPLPWQVQPYTGPPDEGVGIVGLKNGGAYDNPTNGLVAIVTLMPTEIDANDPTHAIANAALIVRSVNALPGLVKALEKALGEMKYIVQRHGYVSTETTIIHVEEALESVKERT